MKRVDKIYLQIIVLLLATSIISCYQVIIDYNEVERAVNETKLNSLVLISQQNNCPKCLNIERMIKSLDSNGKYYLHFFIIHCDMIPKNIRKDTGEKNIMRDLINKICSKQLTMRVPNLYLFSPVDIQIESDNSVAYPNRYSKFEGDFSTENITEFIFSLVSSYSEEVRNLNQMNYFLAQNHMPTFIYFSESNRSSIIFRGLSTYFRKKIKFVWIPSKMNQVRKSFLNDPNSLPSYHLLIQGRVVNCTDFTNFNNILTFISRHTKINLPDPKAVRHQNTYQFFSNFCKDCQTLHNEVEQIQQQKKIKNSLYQIQTKEEFFWSIAANKSSLITQSSLNQILNITENSSNNECQSKREDIILNGIYASSYLVKDSYFNEQEGQINSSDESNHPVNSESMSQINFNDIFQMKSPIGNRFILFKGFEHFDLWEDLKKSLAIRINIFTFIEVDCTTKECTIWARQTYNTLYIPFVLFESSLTGDQPILLQNNLEVIQMYIKIQDYVYLPNSSAIQIKDSDDARNVCNEAFQQDYLCLFYLGKTVPLLFKILSQQQLNKIHFINIQEPSQLLLNKLGAVAEQLVEVDNKYHLSSFIYTFPYLPQLQYYINPLIKKLNYVQYKYQKLSALDQIKECKSKIQIVIMCSDFNSCKKHLNVINKALKFIHYLEYSTIYYDVESVFTFRSEEENSKKYAYIIFNSTHYAQFTVNSYNITKSLNGQVLLVVDQLIQIFNQNQQLPLIY